MVGVWGRGGERNAWGRDLVHGERFSAWRTWMEKLRVEIAAVAAAHTGVH